MQIRVNKAEFVKKLLDKKKRLEVNLAALQKTVDAHNKKVESNRKKAIDQAFQLLQKMRDGQIPAWEGLTRLGIRWRYISGDPGKYKAELEVPVKFEADDLVPNQLKDYRMYKYTKDHIAAIKTALSMLKLATDETVVLSEKMGYNKLLSRHFEGYDTDPEAEEE